MKKKYQIFCATLGLSLIATTSFAHSFGANNLNDQSNYTLTNLAVPKIDKSSSKATVEFNALLTKNNKDLIPCAYDIVFSKTNQNNTAPYTISAEEKSGSNPVCQQDKLNVKTGSNPWETTITYTSTSKELWVEGFWFGDAGKTPNEIAVLDFPANTQKEKVITLQQLSKDTFALKSTQTEDVTGAICAIYDPNGNFDKFKNAYSPATLKCGYQTGSNWIGFDNVLQNGALPKMIMTNYALAGGSNVLTCEYMYPDYQPTLTSCPKITPADFKTTSTLSIPPATSQNLLLGAIFPTGADTPQALFTHPNDSPAIIQFHLHHHLNGVKISNPQLIESTCGGVSGTNTWLECNQ